MSDVNLKAAHDLAAMGQSPARLALGRFLGHRLGVVSALLLILLVVAAVTAPALEAWRDVSAIEQSILNRFEAPSNAHPLGRDELGRDVLARLIRGGQVSLTVGLVTALIGAVIGTGIGLLAGYFGGRLDAALMRVTDGVISLPLLPLLIVLAALDPAKLPLPEGENAALWRIILILSLVSWTTVARLVRGAVLQVRTEDFVRAARALGAGHGRIMLRHILPNVMAPIIVATTLSIGGIILLESVLSFLGLGIQLPTPSWGNMLTGAQDYMINAPHLALWPGLAILITVMAFNFLGDALQAALNPKQPG
ncbi:MAG: ABC transporter permease [Alphaproteobacteria bacterium]